MKNFRAFFLYTFLCFFLAFPLSAQQNRPNFNRIRAYDVQHYIIRVSFDRAEKTVFGDTTIQLKPLQNEFKELAFDADRLNFESIKLEPSGKDLTFRQAGEKIFIALDKSYSPADLISVRLKYSVKPKTGVIFVDEKREKGKITRPAQIWTQNQPEDAHRWFPSYDFPDDKATSEEFITVKNDETAIGNGELIKITENADGTKTFHYKMPVRHSTYLTSFVVGNYSKVSGSYKNIPLGFYVYPGKESIVSDAFGKTKDILRILEDLTGIDFPFNKYDQTLVANFKQFSAMENITATTFYDKDVILVETDSGKKLVEDTVAHELAHSWFGNLVTCRNWAELWLNEGFATYMEAAYREKMYGRKEYLRLIQEDVYEHFYEEKRRSLHHGLFNLLARPDDSIFDTTTYQKGGVVIHMLRETIGDKAFWKAVHAYLARHKFENVETPDLQNAMEEASGKNLDWFFGQWVYACGFPRLEAEQIYNPAQQTLTLTIKQVQEADNLVPAAFILPMDVEITTENGAQIEKIQIDKRNQSFTFKLNGKLKKIEFDKDFKIPLKILKMEPVKTLKNEK